jgi:hypothetical protein
MGLHTTTPKVQTTRDDDASAADSVAFHALKLESDAAWAKGEALR